MSKETGDGTMDQKMIVLFKQRRYSEAEDLARNIIRCAPTHGIAWKVLAAALKLQGRTIESLAAMQKAAEFLPGDAEIHNNLGNTLKDLGQLDEAEASLRKALEIEPGFLEAHSNLLFTQSYMPRLRPHLHYLRDATAYGTLVGKRAKLRFEEWECSLQPERLRVGVVSGDFYQHPVSYFLEGVLAKINPSTVELIAYRTDDRSDELTARIKPFFSRWKTLVGLGDEAAARLIHADGVHLLLDLSGHTAKQRLPVFGSKPAPVQATWLGYWATTGVTEMDYLLADETGVPVGGETQFTEEVWYLPHSRLCFTAPERAPHVCSLPALSAAGQVTFGCFQTLPKVSDQTLFLWGEVLAALPKASLRWQCTQFDDVTLVARTFERLFHYGIAASRVRLLGRVSRLEYLVAYAEVDVVLDTFPFPGGTTTCEALWMGVPTLTLVGDTMLARQGASLMIAAGLPEWVAESKSDFIDRAVSLVGSEEALSKLSVVRAGLRGEVASSPLFNAEKFARCLETALWGMWKRWLSNQPRGLVPAP